MLSYEFDLDICPRGRRPEVKLNQYDEDFTLAAHLFSSDGELTIEAGTTAAIRGTKPDGNGFSADCTIDIPNKVVTVAGDKQMTAVSGKSVFELTLYHDGKELNTINFIINIERAALDKDTFPSESKLRELIQIEDNVDEIINAANVATQALADIESLKFDADQTAETVRMTADSAYGERIYPKWESGGISYNTGEDTTTSKWIRTDMIPYSTDLIVASLSSNIIMRCLTYHYDENGMYLGSTYYWEPMRDTINVIYHAPNGTKYIRVAAHREDNGNIVNKDIEMHGLAIVIARSKYSFVYDIVNAKQHPLDASAAGHDLLNAICTHMDIVYLNKTSFVWDRKTASWKISGTVPNDGAIRKLINSPDFLPAGIQIGISYRIIVDSRDEAGNDVGDNVYLRITIKKSNGTESNLYYFRGTNTFTVPDDCTGIIVAIIVRGNTVLDGVVTLKAVMRNTLTNTELTNRAFMARRTLTEADDLDDVLDPGLYVYNLNHVPKNAPSIHKTIVLVFPNLTGTNVCQLAWNKLGHSYFRAKISDTPSGYYKYASFNSWKRFMEAQEASANNVPFIRGEDGRDIPPDTGILSVYKRAHQLTDIVYTTKKVTPSAVPPSAVPPEIGVVNTRPAQSYVGVPYSSVKEYENYILSDVSIRTFMTAVNNPYSLFYTECARGYYTIKNEEGKNVPVPNYDYNGKQARADGEGLNKYGVGISEYGLTYHGGDNVGPYYGCVCSQFVWAAYGVNVRWPNNEFKYLTDRGVLSKIAGSGSGNVRLMDIVQESTSGGTPTHNTLITDIYRNNRGVPVQIYVSECTTSMAAVDYVNNTPNILNDALNNLLTRIGTLKGLVSSDGVVIVPDGADRAECIENAKGAVSRINDRITSVNQLASLINSGLYLGRKTIREITTKTIICSDEGFISDYASKMSRLENEVASVGSDLESRGTALLDNQNLIVVPSGFAGTMDTVGCRTTLYNAEEFDEYLRKKNGQLYRYNRVYNSRNYIPCEFVAVDDESEPSEFEYNNDICTYAGDYAVFRKGFPIHVNYVKGAYTSMRVCLGDTQVGEISLPNAYNATHSVNISGFCNDAGLYTAFLTNGTNQSAPTHFEVIDAEISVSGTMDALDVHFNKDAKPIYMEYTNPPGGHRGLHQFTASELSDGVAYVRPFEEIGQSTGNVYSTNNYVRVKYAGTYGNVFSSMLLVDEVGPDDDHKDD